MKMRVKGYVYICTYRAAIDMKRQVFSRQKREHFVAEQKEIAEMPTEPLEQQEILVALREELTGLPTDA